MIYCPINFFSLCWDPSATWYFFYTMCSLPLPLSVVALMSFLTFCALGYSSNPSFVTMCLSQCPKDAEMIKPKLPYLCLDALYLLKIFFFLPVLCFLKIINFIRCLNSPPPSLGYYLSFVLDQK